VTDFPALVAANHYLKYHFDPDEPDMCRGGRISFSSQWRYTSAWNRVNGIVRAGNKIDGLEMKNVLRATTEGITEHSIVFYLDGEDISFEVAVASIDTPMWDAPDHAWVRLRFEDVFAVLHSEILTEKTEFR